MVKRFENASLEANRKHDKFLKSMGCLPEQIKARKEKNKSKKKLGFEGIAASYFEAKTLQDVLQGPEDAGPKTRYHDEYIQTNTRRSSQDSETC